jgi:chorismate mutase
VFLNGLLLRNLPAILQYMESRLSSIDNWLKPGPQPFLISGPCSVETQEQYLKSANDLAATGQVHALRGGIWKPRTRPNAFEGVGGAGIAWMTEAREQTGLPIMTEVATADHVELCLQHNFDMLWIGARTTANPFSVQEIAEALKGVDIPIFVKNPVNADLSLWIGALERIHAAGVKRIAAIHRGFSYYGQSIYRNKPMWEIPIALRSNFAQLPILCDPSHICGRRDLLAAVSQRAMDLGFDGLMIESHPTPDQAWSDAAQQITAKIYADLISDLVIRADNADNSNAQHALTSLRSEIDKIDEEILGLIGDRMKLAEQIGAYKKANNMTIFQIERWQEIVQTRTQLAERIGLSKDFMDRYLEQLHKESIRTQTRVMNDAKGVI